MLAAITAGLLFTMATQLAGAQDARAILPLSPESGSVQIAKGLRNGTVQLSDMHPPPLRVAERSGFRWGQHRE
jgi:hypothetical protein